MILKTLVELIMNILKVYHLINIRNGTANKKIERVRLSSRNLLNNKKEK